MVHELLYVCDVRVTRIPIPESTMASQAQRGGIELGCLL